MIIVVEMKDDGDDIDVRLRAFFTFLINGDIHDDSWVGMGDKINSDDRMYDTKDEDEERTK